MHGHEAFQVTLTFPTGVQWEVYFDPQTHLIVEEKATIAGIPQEIYYGDYRSVNGLKLPYKIEMHRGSEVYDVNLTQRWRTRRLANVFLISRRIRKCSCQI